MGNRKTVVKFEDAPVANITVSEMEVFCEKLTTRFKQRLGGKVFRLPTEAEWEYASKGGKNLDGVLGSDLGPRARATTVNQYMAKFVKLGYQPKDHMRASNYNSWEEDAIRMWRKTLPVGKFDANEWGFKDLIGNALEVTADKVLAADIDPPVKRTWQGVLGTWNAGQHYSPIEIDPLRTDVRYVLRGGDKPSGKYTIDRSGKLPCVGFRICVGEKLGTWNNAQISHEQR